MAPDLLPDYQLSNLVDLAQEEAMALQALLKNPCSWTVVGIPHLSTGNNNGASMAKKICYNAPYGVVTNRGNITSPEPLQNFLFGRHNVVGLQTCRLNAEWKTSLSANGT